MLCHTAPLIALLESFSRTVFGAAVAHQPEKGEGGAQLMMSGLSEESDERTT
jgi:hypothetical protein